MKENRDYQIFDSMPYKFSTKKFTLSEKHPLSKERFELGNEFLTGEREVIPDRLKAIWEA